MKRGKVIALVVGIVSLVAGIYSMVGTNHSMEKTGEKIRKKVTGDYSSRTRSHMVGSIVFLIVGAGLVYYGMKKK